MKVYALRHKATGKFMPVRMYRTSGAGWSFWNPYETRPGYLPHDQNPRLFFTKKSAQNAKSMWEKGEWIQRYSRPTLFDPSEEPIGPAAKMPAENPRQKDDLEIVEMRLTVKHTTA